MEKTINGNSKNNYLIGTTKSDALNGFAGDDTLIGGGGNDYLDSGEYYGLSSAYFQGNEPLGNDVLIGGTGDDVYTVNSTGDGRYANSRWHRITEYFNQGQDTVNADLSWTLTENVEKLNLSGNQPSKGYGNNLNNRITGNQANNNLLGGNGNDTLIGNRGNDTLDGGLGKDSLTGGGSADAFLFSSANAGIDIITDFNQAEGDKIKVSQGGFGGGLKSDSAIDTIFNLEYSLSSAQFNTGAAATRASDRFIYNPATGGLFFDIDGTGTQKQIQFATLPTGLSLSNSDIYVIRTEPILLAPPIVPPPNIGIA